MIRSKRTDNVMVYAGPADELASLAYEHATGKHGRVTDDQKARLEAIAERLRNGAGPQSDDGVRFWPDRPDGTPFMGPVGYRPEPDSTWAAAQAARARRQ